MRIIDEKTKEILKNPDDRWDWIKYELMKKNKSLSSIARKNNSDPRTIQTAQKRPYPKVELWIANELEIEVYELFPERYNDKHLPIKKYGEKHAA